MLINLVDFFKELTFSLTVTGFFTVISLFIATVCVSSARWLLDMHFIESLKNHPRNWPHCWMRKLRWSVWHQSFKYQAVDQGFHSHRSECLAPKSDNFSLLPFPLSASVLWCWGSFSDFQEESWVTIPSIIYRWASASLGEPVRHIPATIHFGSVGLGLGLGICIIIQHPQWLWC